MENADIELEILDDTITLSVDYEYQPFSKGTRDEPDAEAIVTIKSIQVNSVEVPDWFFVIVHGFCEEEIHEIEA